MKGWKAVAGVVLVFVLGVAAGGIGVYRFQRHKVDRFFRGSPEEVSEAVVRRLSRNLELDASQKEKVEAIVRRTHGEMRALRQKVHPQMEVIFERGRLEIRAVLRPDQQARFDTITAERRGRWRK